MDCRVSFHPRSPNQKDKTLDRNVITATVLITLILMVWFYFLTPPVPPQDVINPVDSTQVLDTPQAGTDIPAAPPTEAPAFQAPATVTDSTIVGAAQGDERFIMVETDLYEARFSTKGATLVSFLLKEYNKFDQVTPVQMVDTTRGGAISLFFTTPANHNVDTRAFYFDTDFSGDAIRLSQEGETANLTFTANVGQGAIRQIYTFRQGSYEVDLTVEQDNPMSFATQEGYDLMWDGGVPFTEDNPTQEAIKTGAFARSGGEVEGVTLDKEGYEEKSLRGDVSWVGTKNQYFVAVVMPSGSTRGAELVGERFGESDSPDMTESYQSRLLMPPPAQGQADEFVFYIGPMEVARVAQYEQGIYDMVDYGWDFFEWMTRPIAKFVFIPLFSLLDDFIPNYGVIIIILAFLIKAAVYPLTKKSYRSMAQMRELQPRLEAIKEKFGDNPQKQQEATMKLYRESGVNPLGGCLPMFMQYPVIIALWQFLPQSIEIRQQGFLWAHDLSAPDIILNLPFEIPLYGDFVAGFCLLMGISMVIQMRVQSTPSSGPQQKMLMYMMPAMLFFIFNKWAAGLNLYYLCFNVLTAIQQRFINKSIEREKEEGGDENGRDGKGSVRSNGKGSGKAKRLQNGQNGKASRRSSRVKK